MVNRKIITVVFLRSLVCCKLVFRFSLKPHNLLGHIDINKIRKIETFVVSLLLLFLFGHLVALSYIYIYIRSRMTVAKSRREFTRRESSLASLSSSSQTGELLKSKVVKSHPNNNFVVLLICTRGKNPCRRQIRHVMN